MGTAPDVTRRSSPLAGHPGFWCRGLDASLAASLIERTLDPSDLRLREMTRDLARFSSRGQLDRWRPGRDLVFLHDERDSLLGLIWTADKPLPERDDYFDPEAVRSYDPRLTCAIRTYGAARGRGLLTKSFAEYGLRRLLARHDVAPSIWYETKAHNHGTRALAKQLGFFEASGEAGGRLVGIRPGG